MKACIEHITPLGFKLNMFSVPFLGSTKILCDNKSVVRNYFIFSSTLNKNYSSIAYHYVKLNVAAIVVKVAWIVKDCNLAYAFTKRLTSEKRDHMFGDCNY